MIRPQLGDMMKRKNTYFFLLFSTLIMFSGCTYLPLMDSRLNNWDMFLDEVNQLEVSGLRTKTDELLIAHESQPTDKSRLYLAYLLSRPNPDPSNSPNSANQNIEMSRSLLVEINSQSRYKVLGNMLLHEIERVEKNPLAKWANFLRDIDALDSAGLVKKRNELRVLQRVKATDQNSLYLGYLLIMADVEMHVLGEHEIRDLHSSRELLQSIPSESPYFPLSRMLLKKVSLMSELVETRSHLQAVLNQLEMLKNIDDDLIESQREIDEIPE